MEEVSRIRRPEEVVAAMKIARATREALADGIEQHHESNWDSEVLLYELARMLGVCLRMAEASPSRLDGLIVFLRKVYAGLSTGSAPSVEEALRHMCPEADLHEESVVVQ